MSVQVNCRCGQKLTISEEMLGKKIRCGKCQAVLQVPEEVPGLAPSSGEEEDAPALEAPPIGDLMEPPLEPPLEGEGPAESPVEEPAAPALDFGALSFEGEPAPAPPVEEPPAPAPSPPPMDLGEITLDDEGVAPAGETAGGMDLGSIALEEEPEESAAPPAGEGPAAPASPVSPGTDCTIHSQVPATGACPHCQRPFCGDCLHEVGDQGLMCPECQGTFVMKLAARRKQKKLIPIIGGAVAAVALLAVGVYFFLGSSSSEKPENTEQAAAETASSSVPPSSPATPATTTTTSVLVAPAKLPAFVPVEKLDPPPGRPPRPLSIPSSREKVQAEAAKLHRAIFKNIEGRIAELAAELQKDDVAARKKTLQELLQLEHRLALAPVIQALKDKSWKIRAQAASGLGSSGSRLAMKPLIAALKDREAAVRRAAAAALSRCGDETVIPSLIEALNDRDSNVRYYVDRSLKRLSGQIIVFNTRKAPGTQPKAIAQWKKWYESNRSQTIRGDWYALRSPLGQRIAANRFHSSRSLPAVALAHQWLASVQNEQGFWDQTLYPGTDPKTKKEYRHPADSLGLTGLVTLSFLASGHAPKVKDEYRATVSRALAWMLKQQRKDGYFNYKGSPLDAHGICTLAFCEAYGMTGDSAYRPPAEKALQFSLAQQGWSGGFGPGADMSTSGWIILSLLSARHNGLKVPAPALNKALYFLYHMVSPEGYAYARETKDSLGQTRSTNSKDPALTAFSLFCRQAFACPPTDPGIQKSLAILQKQKADLQQLYALHFITQALFQAGGKEWTEWNRQFGEALLDLQEKEGDTRGSWPPTAITDAAHHPGGRIASTALAALTLQTYYRYPGFYK